MVKAKKTRNHGTMTEAAFKGMIMSALRKASMYWKPKNECIKRARVRKGWYKCEHCKKEVPATLPPAPGKKRRIKNIQADHIVEVIDPAVGFENWDKVVKRMFVELSDYQALCHACHQIKTQEGKQIATKRKQNEKAHTNTTKC